MLVRVFEIPPPTGNFHFGGGEPQTFVELDWFHDTPLPSGAGGVAGPRFDTNEGRLEIAEFIKQKNYYRPDRPLLILHPLFPFTMNYTGSR